MRILVVPNEDGFGPSSLISHVVREILDRDPRAYVTIWNRSRLDFNCALYAPEIAAGRVAVEPVWNLIQLAKPDDRVSIPATLAMAGDYRRLAAEYPGSGSTEFDLILDFGVPVAAAWARRKGIPAATVFDHAWSLTLEMILRDQETSVSAEDRTRWTDWIAAIREEETTVREVYAFPGYVMPRVFTDYWRNLGARVHDIGGALGGRPQTDRETARARLGVSEGDVILVQAGDSPVWDEALRRIVPLLAEADRGILAARRLNIVIFIPARLANMREALDAAQLARVRRLEPLRGGTMQEVLPAVDFMITRAGGGSVNDAVACRVPFACVREASQLQTEAILEACLAANLTRSIDEAEFRHRPMDLILEHYDARLPIPDLARGCEKSLVHTLLRHA